MDSGTVCCSVRCSIAGGIRTGRLHRRLAVRVRRGIGRPEDLAGSAVVVPVDLVALAAADPAASVEAGRVVSAAVVPAGLADSAAEARAEEVPDEDDNLVFV